MSTRGRSSLRRGRREQNSSQLQFCLGEFRVDSKFVRMRPERPNDGIPGDGRRTRIALNARRLSRALSLRQREGSRTLAAGIRRPLVREDIRDLERVRELNRSTASSCSTIASAPSPAVCCRSTACTKTSKLPSRRSALDRHSRARRRRVPHRAVWPSRIKSVKKDQRRCLRARESPSRYTIQGRQCQSWISGAAD